MEAAEKAVRFQAYMAEYGIKEKLEEVLTTLIRSRQAGQKESWVSVCARARKEGS